MRGIKAVCGIGAACLIWLLVSNLVGWAGRKTSRLPARARVLELVRSTAWGKSATEIPATLVDMGILRYVPYSSYSSGDFEINVYGDPAAPCCVEIGMAKNNRFAFTAKVGCLDAMGALLEDEDDRQFLGELKTKEDKRVRDGLTFEITPPTAEDAYGGWWISIYYERQLDKSRATPAEIKEITEPAVPRPPAANLDQPPVARTDPTRSQFVDSYSGYSFTEGRKTGPVYVREYYRKDGTYVRAHTRSR